jgi:hypothetical protein
MFENPQQDKEYHDKQEVNKKAMTDIIPLMPPISDGNIRNICEHNKGHEIEQSPSYGFVYW